MKYFRRKTPSETQKVGYASQSKDPVKQNIESKPVLPPKRWRVILLGLLILLLLTGTGAGLGYSSGIQQRLAKENEQRLITAATHYNYGIRSMLEGNFEVARLQFEYVFKFVPDFPGLKEKYTQTIFELAKKNLPTPTPQATSTPDNRGVDALFAQARQEVNSKAFIAALKTLETLRNQDIHYHTLEVDGLFYMALRGGAVEKIIKEGDPEGGLYYFTLANRFAPLDHEAQNYIQWARMYSTAISYWDVDWAKVVQNMAQLYQAAPGIHDSSGSSVRDRYRDALIELGKLKIKSGLQIAACEAIELFQTSLTINNNEEVQDLLNQATNACYPPTPIPTPTQLVAPSAEPTTIEPTATTTPP